MKKRFGHYTFTEKVIGIIFFLIALTLLWFAVKAFLTFTVVAMVFAFILLIAIASWFLVQRYRKKLIWIRDRMDFTIPENRVIIDHINDELDNLYGLKREKRTRK